MTKTEYSRQMGLSEWEQADMFPDALFEHLLELFPAGPQRQHVHAAMFHWWLIQKPMTTGQLTKLAVLLANDPDLEDSEKEEIASKIRKDEAFAPEVATALEGLKETK